jgi:hypothetical protein
MLRMPTQHVTEIARQNLSRFRATSAASELDDDARRWTVSEWTWAEGPPLRVQLRSDTGEVIDFVMDATGVWRLKRESIGRMP